MRQELGAVEAQQRKLVRLYTSEALPDDVLNEESERLNRARQRLERERQNLEMSQASAIDIDQLARDLPSTVARLQKWVLQASGEDTGLLLRALQVQIRASDEQVVLEGILPTLTSNDEFVSGDDLVTTEQTWA